MSENSVHPQATLRAVEAALGARVRHIALALGEVTVVVDAAHYLQAAELLRDAAGCRFEQLLDLCAVDYSTYGDGAYEGRRFCVVSHLL